MNDKDGPPASGWVSAWPTYSGHEGLVVGIADHAAPRAAFVQDALRARR
jgi:hypothetical protein